MTTCIHATLLSKPGLVEELCSLLTSRIGDLYPKARTPSVVNENWICLEPGCPERTKNRQDFDQTMDHSTKFGHLLFMNTFTLEILCVECGIEILDEQINLDQNNGVCKLKDQFKAALLKTMASSFPEFLASGQEGPLGGQELALIQPLSLTNTFTSIMYLFWGVPFFQFIFKRLYLIELENIVRHSRLLTNESLFMICRVIFHLDQPDQFEQHMFSLAWSSFVMQNPLYLTHALVDINELLSDILSLFHLALAHHAPPSPKLVVEESQDVVRPGGPRLLIRQTSVTLTKEVKSPIFASLGGEMQKTYSCSSCNNSSTTVEHFISLNFRILELETIKEIRRKFEEEGYKEGLRTKTEITKKGLLGFFRKVKQKKIVTTLRDYLCHLNLLQKEIIIDECLCCGEKTTQSCSMMLNKPPPIFVIGFIPNESSDSYTESLDYEIDFEIDITPFALQDLPVYELKVVVAYTEGYLGIKGYTTYILDSKGRWMQVSQFEIKEVSREQISMIKMPSLLVYQRKMKKSTERDNLISNYKLRYEMGLDFDTYVPLPNFFMEQRVLLGNAQVINLDGSFCSHGRLPPSYWDIYTPKKAGRLLLGGEDLTLEKKRAVKMERQFCKHREVTYHKILVTSTLMPESVSDYILEDQGNTPLTIKRFKKAWKTRICEKCLSNYTLYKLRRLLEQYLFLKYEDLSFGERDRLVDMTWAKEWHSYLFYDSSLYMEYDLTKNYPLIPPPHPMRLPSSHTMTQESADPNSTNNSHYLKVNKYLAYIINRLYSSQIKTKIITDTFDKIPPLKSKEKAGDINSNSEATQDEESEMTSGDKTMTPKFPKNPKKLISSNSQYNSEEDLVDLPRMEKEDFHLIRKIKDAVKSESEFLEIWRSENQNTRSNCNTPENEADPARLKEKARKKKKSFFTKQVYRGKSVEFDNNLHQLVGESEILDDFKSKVFSFRQMMNISKNDVKGLEVMVSKGIKDIEFRMEGVDENYQHWINEDPDEFEEGEEEEEEDGYHQHGGFEGEEGMSEEDEDDDRALRPEDLRAEQPRSYAAPSFVSKSSLKKVSYNIGGVGLTKQELSKIVEQEEEHGDTSIMQPNFDNKYLASNSGVGGVLETPQRLNTVAKHTQKSTSYYQTVEDAVNSLKQKNKFAKERGIRQKGGIEYGEDEEDLEIDLDKSTYKLENRSFTRPHTGRKRKDSNDQNSGNGEGSLSVRRRTGSQRKVEV